MVKVGKMAVRAKEGIVLIEETLTDGSHVYNVELLGKVSIPCVDFKRAHQLFWLICDQGQPVEI